jgi:hypothetical protein
VNWFLTPPPPHHHIPSINNVVHWFNDAARTKVFSRAEQ